jgi:anti-sigma regulatory factor (Ser/Thr protein kinase)
MKESRTFAHAPESILAARRFVAAVLRDAGGETLEHIELMVSELASNAVRHASSRFDVTVARSDEEIRVEVTDYGAGNPTMRQSEETVETGRGLRIVDTLAASWGCESLADQGKTVWFTVPPAGSTEPTGRAVGRSARTRSIGRTDTDRRKPGGTWSWRLRPSRFLERAPLG